MKRVCWVVCLLLSFTSDSSYADIFGFTDTINAAYNRAYQAFMKIHIVEQIRIAKQNYDQSKKYYDDVKRMSEHKGGIGGYYKEKIKRDIDNANQDIYWRFESYMDSDPDDTAYIKKWVKKVDTYITNKTDYSKEIYDIGKKKDDDLKEMSNLAAKDKLTATELNIYNKKKDLLLLRYLSGIDKGIQWLIKEQADKEARDWESQRKNYIADQKTLKSLADAYKEAQKKGSKKDAYQILKEEPK